MVRGAACCLLASWVGAFAGLGCEGIEGPVFLRATSGSDATLPDALPGAEDPTSARIGPGTTWQVQLSGSPIDTSLDVDLYYLDPELLSTAGWAALRQDGRVVACYISVGSWEPWRVDADAFPAEALGNRLLGYPEERWVDLSHPAVRALMTSRIVRARESGCDAILPANLDAYTEDNGLGIDRQTEVDYARWAAQVVHDAGMSAGLATADELIGELEPEFDWAFATGCLSSDRCAALAPVSDSEKAALVVEFGDAESAPAICETAYGTALDVVVKRPSFDAFRVGCTQAQ